MRRSKPNTDVGTRAIRGAHCPRGALAGSAAALKRHFSSKPRPASLHRARRRLSQEDFRNLITVSSASICCFELLRPVSCALDDDSFVHALYAAPSRCLEASLTFSLWAGRSSVDETIGYSLRELLPEHGGSRSLFRRWRELQLSSQGFESELVDLSGNLRTCHTVIYGHISCEQLSRIWIVMRDITPQARALQALSAAEAHYRSLVERPGLLFVRIRPDGTYEYMSKTTQETLGLSLEEANLTPFSIFRLVHPDDVSRVQAFLDVRREGKDHVLEDSHRLRLRDGTYHWFVVRQFPKRAANGNVECYDIVALDIQEQRDLEQRAERLSSAALVGHLSAGAAHDLNNYLTAIAAQIGAALHSLPSDSVTSSHLQAVDSCLAGCRAIGRQLMELGTPVTSTGVAVRVHDAISAAATLLSYVIPSRISLSVSCGDPEWLVNVDSSQLQRALVNVGLNARDAISNVGTIHISASLVDARRVQIAVSDSGPGIPPEVADKIFQPFFSTKGEMDGHGLGLSTVKSIAETCGGSVAFRNKAGGGAEFSILLPLASDHCSPPRQRAPHSKISGHPRRALTILLAEDMPEVRRALVATLSAAGHNPLPFSDGESLVAFIQQSASPPDACILDENLPGLSGSSLARKLAKAFPSTRFIVASGAAFDHSTTASRSPFVRVQKPFLPEEILAHIEMESCLATRSD